VFSCFNIIIACKRSILIRYCPPAASLACTSRTAHATD